MATATNYPIYLPILVIEAQIFVAVKKFPFLPDKLIPSAEDIFEQTKYVIEGSALKAALASGDSSLQQQIDKAKDRCNIFITTPGRMKYFAHRKIIHFSNVKMLILNDGHQLMSNLFRECITSIVTQEDMSTVQQRQTLIFSKSLSQEIKMSSKEFLNDSYVLDMSTLLVC